jgi:hypothetical protein
MKYRVLHRGVQSSLSTDTISHRRMEYRVLHRGAQSSLSTDTISPM